MYIVFIGRKKHSAWFSNKVAKNQRLVLIKNGYAADNVWVCHIPIIPADHYFV